MKSKKILANDLTIEVKFWYDYKRYCLPHLKGPGTLQITRGPEHPPSKQKRLYRRNHEQNNIHG